MNQKELLKVIEKAAEDGSTTLSLYREDLTSLPAEIGQLKNLTRLWGHTNNLTSLPAELGQLEKLKALLLGGNPLKQPPPRKSSNREQKRSWPIYGG